MSKSKLLMDILTRWKEMKDGSNIINDGGTNLYDDPGLKRRVCKYTEKFINTMKASVSVHQLLLVTGP